MYESSCNVFKISAREYFRLKITSPAELLLEGIIQNFEQSGWSAEIRRADLFMGNVYENQVVVGADVPLCRGWPSCSIWQKRSSGNSGQVGLDQAGLYSTRTHAGGFLLHLQSLQPGRCRIMSDIINMQNCCSRFASYSSSQVGGVQRHRN